jgi:hypothetical protein
MRIVLLFAAAALVLASCQLAGVTQGAQDEGSAASRSLAAKSAAPTTIYCTAALPPECFFFEFDIDGAHKTARVLLPVDSDGYVQGGKVMRYNPAEYEITQFGYDQESGGIYGATAANKGVSYSFAGTYYPEQGFFGSITRTENGVSATGMLGGAPIAAGSGFSNYVGQATYLFETETPQTLIFNVAFNPDAGMAYGTWCESGVGWDFSVHGSISGTGDAKGINFSAIPLVDFNGYLLGPMSAIGQATFKNPTMSDASGTFDINYCGVDLPSLLVATKEIR